jgi:predicted amidohydrolase YtcJ
VGAGGRRIQRKDLLDRLRRRCTARPRDDRCAWRARPTGVRGRAQPCATRRGWHGGIPLRGSLPRGDPIEGRRVRSGTPAGGWIEGEGWNYSAIPGGIPSARDLEGITHGRPAFLFSYDVHTVWMNREALQRLGIVRGSGDVPFGRVARDDDGEPTGFITDFAVMGLSRDGQAALEGVLPSFSADRRYGRLLESLEMATRFGITTVVEPQNSFDDLPLFGRAATKERCRLGSSLRSSTLRARRRTTWTRSRMPAGRLTTTGCVSARSSSTSTT